MHALHRFRSLLQPASFVIAAAVALSLSARCQFAGPQPGSNTTTVKDAAPLRPPAGARVALYEFEDLECPDCARANPLLKEAAEKYHIPWIRHDFPLPFHTWSFDAAVNARWFDSKTKKLGDEFRDAVFANQASIQTLDDLRSFTQKWATDHKIAFPFVPDPQGRLAAAVKADYNLGQSVGVQHTPTIWVVTSQTNSTPFVEVLDRSRLYELIDQALADTKSSAPAHVARDTSGK